MSVNKNRLDQQVKQLENDVVTLKNQVAECDKKKLELIANLNATLGAKQQCELFLEELNSGGHEEKSHTEM